MANDSFKYSLSDRMAARRADKKLGQAGVGNAPAPVADPTPSAPRPLTSTQKTAIAPSIFPAPGMETTRAGSSATIGTADGRNTSTINLSDARPKSDELGASVSAQPSLLGLPKRSARNASGTGPKIPTMNKLTGMPMNTLPGDPAYKAATPAAPKFGSDIAKANIESMGAVGASEDYFKRSAAAPGLKGMRRKNKGGLAGSP